MNPDILFEDRDIIVCHKPAGVPTQSKHVGTPDMISILINYIHKSSLEKGRPYLAVIHRLDQPVEGLLVFARTPAAARELNKQLTEYGFGKHYRALLQGVPVSLEGDLEDYLIKDGRTNVSHVCSDDIPGAKKARLHYKIIETRPPYALADIVLETGRHHQIRVQMAHLGTPIAGDKKYGSTQSLPHSCTGGAPLVFRSLQLFACHLTFRHPGTNELMEFHLNTPVDSLENLHN
ncbi:RluA family pseudouridine synthase [Clostridium sp. C105KSO13]|uniref:RluA family pseudouridine synthase n=1 Tax=Clostridium sp. C105KSO13 TaxID=1776045 RepID=UPI00074088DD|nr:RluA family pseudouridine synthase [Clostridium sp. C105KSO13]CUX34844.1 Ribosomal large subunit pseudouridine synthase D [Clostridium sp. C105KSO13]